MVMRQTNEHGRLNFNNGLFKRNIFKRNHFINYQLNSSKNLFKTDDRVDLLKHELTTYTSPPPEKRKKKSACATVRTVYWGY